MQPSRAIRKIPRDIHDAKAELFHARSITFPLRTLIVLVAMLVSKSRILCQ